MVSSCFWHYISIRIVSVTVVIHATTYWFERCIPCLIMLLFIVQDYTTGPTCNQCKPNNFHLDASNQFGCIQCFCSGVTGQCLSSSWYRQQVLVPAFSRSTQDFKLVEALRPKEPITEGLRVDSNTRELVFQDFSRNSPGVSFCYICRFVVIVACI